MAPAKPKYSKAVKLRARAYLNFVNNRTEPVEETSRDITAIVDHPGLLESDGDAADDQRPHALEDEDSYFIGFGPSEDESSSIELGDLQAPSNGYVAPGFFSNARTFQSQNVPLTTTPEGDPSGHAVLGSCGTPGLYQAAYASRSTTPHGYPEGFADREPSEKAGEQLRSCTRVALDHSSTAPPAIENDEIGWMWQEPEIFQQEQAPRKRPFDTESINYRASSQRPRLGAYSEAFVNECWSGTKTEHLEYRDEETEQFPEENEMDGNDGIKIAPHGCAMHEGKKCKRIEQDSHNESDAVHNPGDKIASNMGSSMPPCRLRPWTGTESEDSRERNACSSVNETIALTHRPRTEPTHDHGVPQAASTPLPEHSISSLNTNPYSETETPNMMPYSSALRPARMNEHARDISESSSTAAPNRPPDLVPGSSSENDGMSDIELNSTSQGQNLDEDDWVTISSELEFEDDSARGASISNHGSRWMDLPPVTVTLLQSGLWRLHSLRSIGGGIIERRQIQQERTEEDRAQDRPRIGNGEPEVVESWLDVPDTEAR